MINYLFVSPLGWTHNVWDILIKKMNIPSDGYDYVEFLNDSLLSMEVEQIDKILENKLSNLSECGTVFTSSFGTVVFLDYLSRNRIQIKNLVVIDGLSEIPKQEELSLMGIESMPETFKSKDNYYDFILEESDSHDLEILEILSQNLVEVENGYQVKLNNQNMLNYLFLYNGIDPNHSLKDLYNLGCIENITIFSSIETDLEYIKIEDTEHLLMLSEPEKIIKNFYRKDNYNFE